MEKLQLNGKEYQLVRYKLRKWLEFEEQQEAIQKAVEDKDIEAYTQSLYILLSTALNVSVEELFVTSWYEVVFAYSTITSVNSVKQIPILKQQVDKKSKPPVWEYAGRKWYWWVHLFSKTYGWSVEYIADLDPDDAIALLQEILTEEQLDKEWWWGLSEIAYPYNKTTKKSDFKPLPRPPWMIGSYIGDDEIPLPAQRFKFRKGFLPVGVVMGEDGNERIVH